MQPYLFIGVVHPERAQITLDFNAELSHFSTGKKFVAQGGIILNQVAVWVDTDEEWNIYDLRNIVLNFVRIQLNLVSYVKSYVYDVDMSRVINHHRKIDKVFGVNVPVIENRSKGTDFRQDVNRLREKSNGLNGIYLNRCFGDLSSAMKHFDDTGLYCYRAIEALRHHCSANHSLTDRPKADQWEKFREVAKVDESVLREIKASADPLRHGKYTIETNAGRGRILTITWDIVDSYLDSI